MHKARTRNEQSFGLEHDIHLHNTLRIKVPILFRYLTSALVFLFLSLTMLSCNNKSVEVFGGEEEAVASENYINAIEELSKSTHIQKAFQFIQENDDQTIKTLIELTELPAPPFMEDQFGRSARFAELLKEYGADSVWTDAVGNVIGLRKGTVRDSVLALAAHLDTVFPEGTDVTVKTRGDTLYAPGIVDDTRGLTTILTVLRAFDANKIETRNDCYDTCKSFGGNYAAILTSRLT
ncbi:MAG: M20/M25/M40 family metallo-hydrolase [Balneolaceae bacterium]